MATIITVHGTFASGPEEGGKWWQRGSQFTREIEHLVAAEQGPLTVEPLIWDGLNSELSRRAAGRRLYERMKTLNDIGEPFCVIGHSHGGSVIASALMESSHRRDGLASLGRWITVGTPFIQTARQRFLFLRLGLLGKSAFLAVILFALLGALALIGADSNVSIASWPIAITSFFAPVIVFRLLFVWLERRWFNLYDSRTTSFAAETHRPRWLSLWQADDEAVQGLRSVKSLDFDLFPRAFAVGPLSLLSLVMFPLLALMLLNSEPAMNAIAARVFAVAPAGAADELFSAAGKSIPQNALVLLIATAILPASFVFDKQFFVDGPMFLAIVFFAFAALLFMLAAVAMTLAVTGLAHALSALLSRILNPTTRAQIRAKAYGSDTQEDHAVDVNEWPMWLGGGYPPLNDPMSSELRTASDRAIATRMTKFRDAVRALTAVSSRDQRADMLSEYLTWEELIHTTYFNHPDFRKLIAYAISRTKGFRPTEAFRNDPDFARIANIHAELTARFQPLPQTPATL